MRCQTRSAIATLAALLVGGGSAAFHATPLRAEIPIGRNARSSNLQETLESGLRARRPEEFKFIERVVELVEKDRLPLDMVRSTFDWARRKRPYPFPYFERALKIRAARRGIVVK